MKRLILLLTTFAVVFVSKGATYTVTVDDIDYTIDTGSGEATCTGPTSTSLKKNNVVILDNVSYDGAVYPVTSIKNFAFWNCSGFTGSLTIGDNVQTIGGSAFWNCSGFTGSLTIGDNVQTIGDRAFYDCSGFTGSLTIPDNVQTIGDRAFYDCNGFTGSLTIGDNVQTIGEAAFSSCIGLTGSLTIGDNVQTIGEAAFSGCIGFTGSLTIPDNVQTIGDRAFSSCIGLTGSLTIGDNVQTIGDRAFIGCSGFTGSLTIGDNVQTIGEAAFSGCSGLTGSLTIPNNVQTIGADAFWNCSGFTGSLTIGDNVRSIGKYAFSQCIGFTGELVIPESVKEIKESCFLDCDNLTSLIITSSNTVINYFAFACDGLKTITCLATTPPKCVYGIFDYVFGYTIYNNTPLYVPAESVSLYKTATEWKKFKYINPITVEVTDIKLNKSELELLIGESETLTATITPEDAPEEIVWSVNEEGKNIVSVDQNGKVTGLSVGTATVTATAGKVSASVDVTVYSDAGVDEIFADGDTSPIDVFALDGKVVMLKADSADIKTLSKGFYIVRRGATVKSILVR